jgi:putative FmdB family regulatory protein
MPIYEYKCDGCGKVTTELRPNSEREEPLECPRCNGSAEVILSTFATTTGDSKPDCWSSVSDCGPT